MRCNLDFIGRLTLVGACAVALSAGAAQANTVSLKFTGTGAGRNVNVTSALAGDGTIAGAQTFNVQARVLNLEFESGFNGYHDYATFCTEIAQNANNNFRDYTEDSLANLPQPGATMGEAAATAIKRMWAFAGDNKFTDNNWAAAFQVAVWEVVDEFIVGDGTLDIHGGAFKVNSGLNATALGYVSQLLAAAVNEGQSQANLRGLYRDAGGNDAQDYLVEVPEPSSIALLAIGCACVAGIRLRRRRRLQA